MAGALAAKMVAAMAAIDAVTKRGRNEKQGYAYVKAADVANEVRSVLTEHGIAFSYSVLGSEHWEKPTQSGGLLTFVQLMVAVTFTDKDSGESDTMQTIGWGMDSGDKAPYKAMTGALKYALRMVFLIPDESDPENDSADDPRKPRQIEAEEKWNKVDPPTPENMKHNQIPAAPQQKSKEQIMAEAKARADALAQKAREENGKFEFTAPNTLVCVPRSVEKKTRKVKGEEQPFLRLVLNGYHNTCNSATCFDDKLFEALAYGIGKECALRIRENDSGGNHYVNIDDVLAIDGQPYDLGQPSGPF